MKPNKSSPLIERLRDYADADTEEAADALERLAREKHEAQDCFDAAKAEIERLTAHDQFLADAKVEDRK